MRKNRYVSANRARPHDSPWVHRETVLTNSSACPRVLGATRFDADDVKAIRVPSGLHAASVDPPLPILPVAARLRTYTSYRPASEVSDEDARLTFEGDRCARRAPSGR